MSVAAMGQTGNFKNHKSTMSSQIGNQIKQSSTRNLRTSSTSSQGHFNPHQQSQPVGHHLNRQKSSVSVVSAGNAVQGGSGSFSSRLMSGTISSNVKQKASKIYNERMLSRAASVNSTNSIGAGARTRASYAGLQNSEAKSMVRVALKNQRRNEKIAVLGTNPTMSTAASNGTTQEKDRYQRLRVNSGVPFLRAGTGTGAGGGDYRNQRTASNLSRQGGVTGGRLSTIGNT